MGKSGFRVRRLVSSRVSFEFAYCVREVYDCFTVVLFG